jgi:hypothetical protein
MRGLTCFPAPRIPHTRGLDDVMLIQSTALRQKRAISNDEAIAES